MNIVCRNETLAIALLDSSKAEKIIELRLSKSLERLWSLKIDIEYSACLFRFCPVNPDS